MREESQLRQSCCVYVMAGMGPEKAATLHLLAGTSKAANVRGQSGGPNSFVTCVMQNESPVEPGKWLGQAPPPLIKAHDPCHDITSVAKTSTITLNTHMSLICIISHPSMLDAWAHHNPSGCPDRSPKGLAALCRATTQPQPQASK